LSYHWFSSGLKNNNSITIIYKVP